MNPAENDLENIIDGCIKGDRKSQQTVYERYYGKMKSLCIRYARDADEAQDLLQDGFMKVFTKIEKYNRQGSFEGWMRRIIVNNAIDHYRRKKNDFIFTDSDYILDSNAEAEYQEEVDDGDDTIQVDQILAAIQKLSPAYQTVFNLYVMEEYTHQQIADQLGISVGTSKSNLAKAKANLKKILQLQHTRKV